MAAMFADRAGKTRLAMLYREIGINIDIFENRKIAAADISTE
mgnify:CR=1 FL=1